MAVKKYLRKHWLAISFYISLALFGGMGWLMDHLGHQLAADCLLSAMVITPLILLGILLGQEDNKKEGNNGD